jgi:hypothetical protein
MRRFTGENAKTMQAARSGRQGDCDPEKEEIALQASGPERAWSMHHADRKNPSTIHAKRENSVTGGPVRGVGPRPPIYALEDASGPLGAG